VLNNPTQSFSNLLIKMKYSFASIASLVAAGECLSLPPLIPSIPGVTDPLTTNAPPLPILQVPTPPLESPPFTPSDIQPKKIGYFWTGSADKFHKGEGLSINIGER
jgi:selenium-binding protein 1